METYKTEMNGHDVLELYNMHALKFIISLVIVLLKVVKIWIVDFNGYLFWYSIGWRVNILCLELAVKYRNLMEIQCKHF